MVERTGKFVSLLIIAGLIPFIVAAWGALRPWQLAGVLFIDESENIIALWQMTLLVLLIYGGVIFSFLGGARWGTALADEGEKAPSFTMFMAILPAFIATVCSIMGVSGLLFGDPLNGGVGVTLPIALYILAAGYLILLAFDVHTTYPILYVRLRIFASLVAIACLLTGAIYAS
ncbi:DUF3429 domain-containing protein [Ponticaulis sp.]|uniref:DUF3429 domain-containing protein n=1 Tax=Ponticaulis sp. TaxID=2020902 RepID=UPI000B631835|nr:DUF3429 domain-containing protein [Ponticaulis sp.]MAI90470.1 hypothetical protein [Ponticaulis sp.]OUY00167.1 MAG: hypothetical protein CBB65_08525 [Hyphomonadaceae bacterium TMED5]|tara:strand:- start:86952 stop:87473 length:522 start_codon:yes stop_codon:yes gene_type:complete